MNITQTIQIDMTQKKEVSITASAVSGENGTRFLCFELLENNAPWTLPQGCRPVLAFRTEAGLRGEYDTMPDGTGAFTWEGNRVTVALVDQILALPGVVELSLRMQDAQLHQAETFRVLMMVQEGMGDLETLPGDYYQVRSLEEINGALDALEAEKADGICLEGGNRLYLTSGGEKLGEGVFLTAREMGFDGGYADGAGMLHLTTGTTEVEGMVPMALTPKDGLAWNLGAYGIYESGRISMVFTSTEDGARTIQIAVDGARTEAAQVSKAGERASFVMEGLTHGAHTIHAWTEITIDGVTVETERQKHIALVVTEQSPVVAVLEPVLTLRLGETVRIPYVAVDPEQELAQVQLIQGKVSESLVVEARAARRVQYWEYEADTPGEVTLSVDCDNAYGSGTADIELLVVTTGMTLQTPEYVDSVAACTDIHTLYLLPDGYLYGYLGADRGFVSTQVQYANYVLTAADEEHIADRILERLDVSYVSSDKVLTVGAYTFRYDGDGIAQIGVST